LASLAIHYIKLDVLEKANFLSLSEDAAKHLLTIEMEKEKYTIDRSNILEMDCVCDIMSNHTANFSGNWFTSEKTPSSTRRAQGCRRIET
jgi:hypothetical protein